MKRFKIIIENGDYSVRLSGAKIYITRKNDDSSKVIKTPYTYYAKILPLNNNILIAKSTEPFLYIINIEEGIITKKIRINSKEPQDSGFCFSDDSTLMLNTRLNNDMNASIEVYETTTFELVHTYNCKEDYCLYTILAGGAQYEVTGYDRDVCKYFIAKYHGDAIFDIVYVKKEVVDSISEKELPVVAYSNEFMQNFISDIFKK